MAFAEDDAKDSGNGEDIHAVGNIEAGVFGAPFGGFEGAPLMVAGAVARRLAFFVERGVDEGEGVVVFRCGFFMNAELHRPMKHGRFYLSIHENPAQ